MNNSSPGAADAPSPAITSTTPGRLLGPLQRAARQLGSYLEPRLAARGLTPDEADLLVHISAGGATTPGALGRSFAHKASTLTGLLDRLETKELIARSVHPRDRRSFLILATKAGTARAREVRWDLLKLEEQIIGRMGPADLVALERLLAAVRELAAESRGKES